MSSYPGNHTVQIQTGTVDIIPSTGTDRPVIARLPVRMGEADLVKRRAYLMAASPGLAAALKNLVDLIQEPNLKYAPQYLDALEALKACALPETRT